MATRPAADSPVALFIFNRPAHTRRVLEVVAQARPRLLLVVADGPRAGHPDDIPRCQATRALVDAVDWPCEVRRHFAEDNLGCLARLSSGLGWVFSQVPEAIILEDDCLPDPSFFPFCTQLLARYRDEERIHMIRGYNPVGVTAGARHSYRCSFLYNIWGWATWARAWEGYDLEMARWPGLRDSDWLDRFLPDRQSVEWVRKAFDAAHRGEANDWSFQFAFHGWLHERVALVPRVNLVQNIGFGADATHPRAPHDRAAAVASGGIAFPLLHPPELAVAADADARELRVSRPDAPALRTLEHVGRLLRRIARRD